MIGAPRWRTNRRRLGDARHHPPPRQAVRPPEPRPRTQPPPVRPLPSPASPVNYSSVPAITVLNPTILAPTHTAPPRLIRPSEHLAIVERAKERRPVPLVPTVTVVQGPRPSLPPQQPQPPVYRPVLPPPMRMPAPAPRPVMRLPQPRRDIQ
ncbi:hypothetical protein ACJJTC_008396, partial [Scirpophaga incertulas]